ncbi:MAG: phosphoribosylformylglycinamidine synthase subunit PurQ [Candidatus Sigynarchaeum springense]
MMKTAKALVLKFPGTNCQVETSLALRRAGFNVTQAHVNELLRGNMKLDDFQLLALPGGFSYGDDIASGKVGANKLVFLLRDQLFEFARHNLIIGICNGFQTLVKAGLLPAIGGKFEIQSTLTFNDIGHFYCNYVKVKNVNKGKCIYTKGIDCIEFPVAHGEGKFILKDPTMLRTLVENDQVVFKFVLPNGEPANGLFPYNTSNTLDDITGVCDPSGRILGMMPHPERYLYRENHPQFTSGKGSNIANGMIIFKNAHAYVIENLL